MNLDFGVYPLATQAISALEQVGERARDTWGRAACWLYGCADGPTSSSD